MSNTFFPNVPEPGKGVFVTFYFMIDIYTYYKIQQIIFINI